MKLDPLPQSSHYSSGVLGGPAERHSIKRFLSVHRVCESQRLNSQYYPEAIFIVNTSSLCVLCPDL